MQPLAYRMRPKNLDEVVGQEHLVGNKKIIRRMVEAKLLSSMILYGPPGIGKTSIASAIAGSTKYAFRKLNAATDTKKDLQIVAEEGKMSGTVILLLDEIHRLDKTKQDFLLPLLESGNIILIGATTENPYISISPAIRSRCQIFELHRLKEMDISHAIDRALKDSETGLGKYNVELTKDARNLLIEKGNGDLRATLNALELAVLSTKEEKQENADNKLVIDKAEMQDSIQFKSQNYDANGDGHYDLLSAFQKSIRGSDTDAALYYLGNLCESGDLVAICRRLLVIAYEDVGLANPPACSRAVNAVQAAQMVGLPEARIILSNAVIELCLSPKSNSAITAIDSAISDIQNKQNDPIPDSLKDAHYKGAATLNHGVSYLYPHDFQGDWIAQQYLPNNLKNVSYFNPKGNSKVEDALKRQYLRLKKMQKDGLQK
ncbi:recombinase RarA [Lactobacillus johnsonii]|uniref:Replication-associated recombination protein A n=1 Tax=Lactobacillus johnsonii TaxID=33959 RepID=A0AAW5LY73_LACJH|nr:replication-associated recombination protein A [Lactobacillus johnsonii]MCI6230408.1 replication-associated recombination protein A [Lactobacillus johnsonii]MCR1913901.1 replication-associated recombination protein A [Lactobacillus johnsonii]MCT3386214.1 replication-associated recombination protein A [Lactobacillus johnsonii]MDD7747023.1 replication-associated recombination protein A [Lactobacillus johnsonii]MDO5007697.1 replication-associated recombination protein A [Lactobacillus johnsoni